MGYMIASSLATLEVEVQVAPNTLDLATLGRLQTARSERGPGKRRSYGDSDSPDVQPWRMLVGEYWVAFEELKLRYHNPETIEVTIYHLMGY